MKNNEKNSNKKIAGIYYFASLCFYIAAIINFINGDNNSIAVVFLCLGSKIIRSSKNYNLLISSED